MKENFKNNQNLECYINKFVKNYTNLERKCQICGKPALIKHNYISPYEIQLLCRECRKNLSIDNKNGMYKDIPLIDSRNYVVNQRVLTNNIKLTKEKKQELDRVFSKNITKGDTLKELNLTEIQYQKLLKQYEEKYDKDIRKKLSSKFRKFRGNLIKEIKLKSTLDNNSNNKISYYKLKNNVSNREMSKVTELTSSQISNIQTGKAIPTMLTKCKLANFFKVSVADIFPEDTEFNRIYNYNDYIWLNRRIGMIIAKIRVLDKNIITKIHNAGISRFKIYNLIDDKVYLNNDDIKLIKDYLNKYLKENDLENQTELKLID